MKAQSDAAGEFPDLHCACATIRRSARLVTQLYSEEMGESVEPTQYALLYMLSHRPGETQAVLCRDLGLDKTTLSRNLRILERSGWIEAIASRDRRERGYRLTPEGTRLFSEAKGGWSTAQAKLRDALEPGEWEAMFSMLGRIAKAAREARKGPTDRSVR